MAIGSDNKFPKVVITEGSTPSNPSAGDQKVFIDSADHKLKRVNSAGAVTTIEGGGGTPTAVGARVKRASGNVSITTTFAAIGFDAEDFDTDGFHDNSTNNSRLTVPTGKGGKYHISASGYGDVDVLVAIRVNGTSIAISSGKLSVIAGFSLSADYSLAQGDYVELFVRTASGTGNVVYDASGSPQLSMMLIGT